MAFSFPFSRQSRKHKSKTDSSRRRGARLNLEVLEDRTLPAVSIPQLFVADVYVTEFGRSAGASEIVGNAN